MPLKPKGKMYRTIGRPAMIYPAETLASLKKEEKILYVNEMSIEMDV